MRIRELLSYIDVKSAKITPRGETRRILDLCHNSKYATPNCLFFCKSGALTDGHIYAPHAYKNGARIFIAERHKFFYTKFIGTNIVKW